jgi:HSP20 family protein
MTDKKPSNDDSSPQIDLNLNLGGMFKGLGDMLNLLAELSQRGNTINQSGAFGGKDGQGLHGVYGFTVRTGIGGAPAVERFGTVRQPQEPNNAPEVREPLVDIFDEGAALLIIAEVPGVSEEELDVRLVGDVLALESSGKRRYAKEILLPAVADPASLQRSYRNGILEIRLRKQE